METEVIGLPSSKGSNAQLNPGPSVFFWNAGVPYVRQALSLSARTRSAMTSRRIRHSGALAAQGIDLALAVPQVLAHRMMRMALAGASPSRRDRREFYRMGAEKIAAFYEAWIAMSTEILRASLEVWLAPALYIFPIWPVAKRSSRAPAAHFQRAALAVLGGGVAPFHRRAVANAKRLGRGR